MTDYLNELPNLDEVESGLKDFQIRTANAVFDQLYRKVPSTNRFLVADEVGLGKTLIARSIIARTLHHLQNLVERINIVYVCSNANIARQNISRLNVLRRDGVAFPTRITLLPIRLQELNQNRINLISLTPGTSLDLKRSLGIERERILLYWILKRVWNFSDTTPPKNIFQGGVWYYRSFRERLKKFAKEFPIDQSVIDEFRHQLEEHEQHALANGSQGLREQFDRLCSAYWRPDAVAAKSPKVRSERARFISELRRILAKSCVNLLKPDLVILDEFQRFKHVLDGNGKAAELARRLFEYSNQSTDVRVLLLSATPYKMYTQSDESEDEDHYRDFISTLRFLFGKDTDKEVDRFTDLLRNFRDELIRFTPESAENLQSLSCKIQKTLRKVMVRTERLAVTEDREGMLTEIQPNDVELQFSDALAYVELQSIARELNIPNTIEYWKSSSYLLNFMEDYKLKHKLEEELEMGDSSISLSRALTKSKYLLLSWQDIRKFNALDPRNARLRGLIKQVIDTDLWQLLWLPSALHYYELEGPYRNFMNTQVTKRLIFSSWRVVPKVVSTVLSYEAERKSVLLENKDSMNTEEERERRARNPLLRIAVSSSNNRPTGMPVLALMYPSTFLARQYDPFTLVQNQFQGDLISLSRLQSIVESDIEKRLRKFDVSSDDSQVDDQWYWAAAILLDNNEDPQSVQDWFFQSNLHELLGGEDTRGDIGWQAHIEHVRQLLNGDLALGRKPDDLAKVLTLIALGSPAVCSFRALNRNSSLQLFGELDAMNAAGMVGWAFRTLYNRPEVIALLRGLQTKDDTKPYWQRVLEYGTQGCLQAVLDEYVHILKDSLGILGDIQNSVIDIAKEIHAAVSVRTSVLAVDEIYGNQDTVSIDKHRLPTRFAMPFGQGRDEESGEYGATRAEKTRTAFNSPFWPFVLTSTSIGQEGLDFHWYCHAVVHWNLPGNPVDLEQREGRVHRYKGHAVRKNIASSHSNLARQSNIKDPWEAMLEAAKRTRKTDENDLVPFWIYPIENGARIERYVPSLPLTKDRQLLDSLRRSLAVYRLVFGQPRQEDLVNFLNQHIPKENLEKLISRLRIDLSPQSVLNIKEQCM